MNIIILGPQGSGKGTQARLIVKEFNLFYVSTGDILREIAEKDVSVRNRLNKGVLLPDRETFEIIVKYLERKGINENILFDGYPRSVPQYELFKNWLNQRGKKIDLVIVLNISEEETIRRLSARREDPATGKIYNLITEPPGPEVDLGRLVQRDDDKPEAIRVRLEEYRSSTLPLIEELRKDTKVVEIAGERTVEEIAQDIKNTINETNG